MKKKIIAYLSLLLAFFSIGSLISILYITFTTSELKKIITLHGVEILRQDLVIKIQNVEQDLLTVHTELSSRLDAIVLNVNDLDNAINNCNKCHHSPLINRKLDDVHGQIEKFKTSLSYYITAAANEERIRSLKLEAYNIGHELLNMTTDMAFIANKKLQERTQKVIEDVSRVEQILVITLMATFFIGLWMSVHLTRNIINPIRQLIELSRKIASGNLGSTTTYTDSTEFGELAASFNDMSLSLRESNEKVVRNLHRLSGLYRVTLPLHSVSDAEEIVRAVSFGVAEFLSVEQCGLLLLDEKTGYFEHARPAVGIAEAQAALLRISRKEVEYLYNLNHGKPLLMNDLRPESLPEGIQGKGSWAAHNILLGWVRKKGDLIGVIRLANKKEGRFDEETGGLLGIISNNVSVAIENARLYESLRLQMQQLKETQEQLVQTARLAAIGELASNVAHEINNPLTSILGYAELIKEEGNVEHIMGDIEIITNESLRAREIVQQLLEFARKKTPDMKEFEVNSLLKEVVSLIKVQFKDKKIKMYEAYSELPRIMGDQNQLKQVFLNIINNAVDALPEGRGEITIGTHSNDSYAVIEIRDTGPGIAAEVLPRIFEPFYTTKKEKGTGLGLPISYKIIQSHNGRIDVKSIKGEGTVFSISLPLLSENREQLRTESPKLSTNN
ncbi:MAG: ATP-binding protein [Nitrospirota bacterium]|nr:ATP-binding protein [Nitrospirota bacterium]